ncbi:unnamed protein product [Zymoseptoria tritici ST99CH_3D7]|uniref:Uncharacterized protein n=1 Tax=Zymoseptoria tritici (strain ST99CH_3D7) TaxID=1276538 RepID=A0A1X7RCK8_ZYMT9|nr:unnamed protein product [Zymoseptoria tritici ST99CH_3D7]
MPSARERSLRQLTGANDSPRKLSFTTIKEARAKLRSTATIAGHAIKTFVRPITALMVEEKTQPRAAATNRFPSSSPPLARSNSLPSLSVKLIKDVTAKAKTAGEKMRHSTSFEGLGQRQLVKDATSTLKATGQRFRNSTSFEGLREKFTGLGLNPMESIHEEEEQDLRPCQKAYLRSQNRSTTTRSTSITTSPHRELMSMSELHSDAQRASFPRRSTTTSPPPRRLPIDRTSITTLAISPPNPTPAAILLHHHNTQTLSLLSILQTLRHSVGVPFLTLSPTLSAESLTLARHCIDWQTPAQRARPERTIVRVVNSMRLVVFVGPAGVSAGETGKLWRDHPEGIGAILEMAWFTVMGLGQREGRWVVVLMLDEEDLWRGLRESERRFTLEELPYEEGEEEED